MRTLLSLTVLLLTACGVSQAELNDPGSELGSDEGELSASSRSYVVLRHDTMRRCPWPRCGGVFVHDVNRASVRETYVYGLDFSTSTLTEEQQVQVMSAGASEMVLHGKLGPVETNGFRRFQVTTAWRGMPGVKFTTADSFYRVAPASIQCLVAPCPSLRATKLNSTSTTLHHDLDVGRASMTAVDQNWLTFRVTDKDALVAGRFVEGATVNGTKEQVLDASQVFLKIPDMTQSCGRPAIARCPDGKVNLWTRDENRCTRPAGWGGGGACAAVVPACAEGYTLMSWTGGPFGCTQYACDPAFLFE